MDAIEFLNKHSRMCKYYEGCTGCPIQAFCFDTDPEEMVNAVEKWAKEHPQKTIMQDFFEKFPNAPKNKNGEPMTCPYNCGYGNFCCEQVSGICYDCWSHPLED